MGCQELAMMCEPCFQHLTDMEKPCGLLEASEAEGAGDTPEDFMAVLTDVIRGLDIGVVCTSTCQEAVDTASTHCAGRLLSSVNRTAKNVGLLAAKKVGKQSRRLEGHMPPDRNEFLNIVNFMLPNYKQVCAPCGTTIVKVVQKGCINDNMVIDQTSPCKETLCEMIEKCPADAPESPMKIVSLQEFTMVRSLVASVVQCVTTAHTTTTTHTVTATITTTAPPVVESEVDGVVMSAPAASGLV